MSMLGRRVKKLEKTIAALEAACEELKIAKTRDGNKDAAQNSLGTESFLVRAVACVMLAVAALVWMGALEAVAWRPLVAGIMSCPQRGWEGCSINIMTSITHPRLAIAYHTLGVDSNVDPDEAKAAHRALVGSSCTGCSSSELLRLAERKEGANKALELVMRVGRVREGAAVRSGPQSQPQSHNHNHNHKITITITQPQSHNHNHNHTTTTTITITGIRKSGITPHAEAEIRCRCHKALQ